MLLDRSHDRKKAMSTKMIEIIPNLAKISKWNSLWFRTISKHFPDKIHAVDDRHTNKSLNMDCHENVNINFHIRKWLVVSNYCAELHSHLNMCVFFFRPNETFIESVFCCLFIPLPKKKKRRHKRFFTKYRSMYTHYTHKQTIRFGKSIPETVSFFYIAIDCENLHKNCISKR